MNVNPPDNERHLLLVGGGHSHAVVLRKLALSPLSGARITLVSAAIHTPYSGMLPGMIAGHYDYDATHIDLEPLARAAGVRLIRDAVTGLDLAGQRVLFAERPPLPFDILSLDIGSTPSMDAIPGARDHTLPVKPIARFLPRWEELKRRVLERESPPRLATVGAGAGGVELTLAVQYSLGRALQAAGRPADSLRIDLFFGSDEILATHPPKVRRKLSATLGRKGITLHPATRIAAVEAGALLADDGTRHPVDEVFWVTQAGAAPWLANAGLATDDAGFVAVDACLRSVSHPAVFAAGDVAAVLPHPREKAGVFAVRQGPPLEQNLRRVLAGADPEPFEPQRRFLTIISTGDRSAVASRGSWAFQGRLMWRWKDWIDRRFMALFSELPQPPADPAPERPLVEVVAQPGECGHDGGLRVSFRLHPPLDDPWVFGRIAATHALGEILARGARPRSAQLGLCLPGGEAASGVDGDEALRQIMAGAQGVFTQHETTVAGDATVSGDTLSLALTVEGSRDDSWELNPGSLVVGDALLLSKPLGTGVLLSAARRGLAKGRWILAALAVMERSLAQAAHIVALHDGRAAAQVGQGGLAGQLVQLLDGAGVGAQIALHKLPLLDGVLPLFPVVPPSAQALANRSAYAARLQPNPSADASTLARGELLFDPQLSGGLLVCVPAGRAEACLAALRGHGDSEAAIIGRVLPAPTGGPTVQLVGD